MKLKKEKGPLGLSFFVLNYPSRCRGRDSKDCFSAGAFFFDFNYPTPWRGWGE